MIRINLLPVRHVRKVQASQRHLVIAGGALFVTVVICFFLYESKASEVETKNRQAQEVETEIAKLKRDIGDFDKLQAERDKLVQQKKIINDLQKGRTGPVRMLREISDILSQGKGPTVDQQAYEELLRTNPNGGYNPEWDPRRVWIESFTEKNKGISVSGKAKDHDDVAELMRRLQLSKYFRDVRLYRNDQRMESGVKVVQFSLTFRAVFAD